MKELSEEEYIEKVYKELAEWEQEVYEHNKQLINSISKTAWKHYLRVIEYCRVDVKIEIVDTPKGTLQTNEKHGPFLKIYVDQWGVGMEGDSFEGHIYAKYQPDKWLKIRYSC